MEFNHSNIEKSDQQIRWSCSDHLDHQGSPVQVRSYTCAFCKRGFSNAQALGGHMNIHRRDRAKLKQSSEENLLSLDISIKNPTGTTTDHDPRKPTDEKNMFRLDGGCEGRANDVTKLRNFSSIDSPISQRGKAVVPQEEEHQQLPLFLERSAANRDSRAGVCMDRVEDLSHSHVKLDLELRLGPEPYETPSLSTREFF